LIYIRRVPFEVSVVLLDRRRLRGRLAASTWLIRRGGVSHETTYPRLPDLGTGRPRVYTKYASDPGPKSNRIGPAQWSRAMATPSAPTVKLTWPSPGVPCATRR